MAEVMHNTSFRREVAIAAGSLALGFVILPLAIYAVGQWVVGDYGDDLGALALAETIWRDFLGLRPAALFLVLSPYATVQLVRVARRLWRREEL